MLDTPRQSHHQHPMMPSQRSWLGGRKATALTILLGLTAAWWMML